MHKHVGYLAEVDKAIDELMGLPPTADRASAMHDYLYVKSNLTKRDGQANMAHAAHADEQHTVMEKPASAFGGY